MAEENRYYGAYGYYPRLASWGAIWSGLFVALAIFVMLQLLGAGIGISSIDILHKGDNTQGSNASWGAAIWSFCASLVALFFGGLAAGYFANSPKSWSCWLHGLVVWAFFYIVLFWLVTTMMAAIIGGAVGMVGKGISAAGQAASSQQGQQVISKGMHVAGVDPNQIKAELGNLANQNAEQNKKTIDAIENYLKGDRTPEERQQVVQSISKQTGKSPQDVNETISKIETKAQHAKKQVKKTGQEAINITGGTLIGLAIAMFIGIWFAIWGAAAGAPDYGEEYTGTREHTHRHE